MNCNLQRLDGPVRGNGEDHPGARGALPRLGLERAQGDLGRPLGPAAREGPQGPAPRPHGAGRRRRLPELQGARRRLHARALLRHASRAARARRQHDRRRHLAAEPRRPRPAEGLRRLRRRREARGPADGDPRQDREGLRHGRGRRGDELHPPAEEDRRGRAEEVPRPLPDPDLGRRARAGPLLQARRDEPRDALHARAPRGARRLAARPAERGARAARPAPRRVRRAPEGHRRPRHLDHDGPRADDRAAHARPRARPADRAHRGGRGAHVRHGRPVPPARDLCVRGAALRARRLGPGHVLPRGPQGPDPAGGDHGSGRRGVLDRRRDVVQQPRPPARALLPLLLDVRLPARRRPLLGRRRQPRAGLPDRRHRGSDDARGRGPAAPGRPQPGRRRGGAELRLLRPGVRRRARGDRPRRAAPHARGAGRRLLLRDRRQRELRPPAARRRRGGRNPARDVSVPRGRRARAARAAPRRRHDPARGDRGGGPPARRLRGRCGRLERHELHRAPPRRRRGRALEPAAPRRAPARELRRAVLRGPAARSRGGRDGLGARLRRTRSAPSCRGATTRSEPTASAAPTCARSCAGSSR